MFLLVIGLLVKIAIKTFSPLLQSESGQSGLKFCLERDADWQTVSAGPETAGSVW